jgi:hypothetical protein
MVTHTYQDPVGRGIVGTNCHRHEGKGDRVPLEIGPIGSLHTRDGRVIDSERLRARHRDACIGKVQVNFIGTADARSQ